MEKEFGLIRDKQFCTGFSGENMKQVPNSAWIADAGNTRTNDTFSLRISVLLA